MEFPYNFAQLMDGKTKFVVLGDTDSMFLNIPNLKPKTAEEAVKEANKIAEEINNLISSYTSKTLLPKLGISSQYNRTSFKTELVCNGLLLLAVKKNYAYRLLAKEGKIFNPTKVMYTGIGVKSDQTKWTKDFIKELVEDVILNINLNREQCREQINNLAEKYRLKIDQDLENLDFDYIGIPKKWGTGLKSDPWQVIAMKLFNSLMNEKILVPMSPSLIIPIRINAPQDFETKLEPFRHKEESMYFIGDIPISNMNYLAVPYNYNKQKLKEKLNYFNITISPDDIWDKVYNKTLTSILNIFVNSNKTIL